MFKPNKKNFFRLLAILTMGSVYLSVVFYRLPSPFHTPTLYLLLWFGSLIIFYPSFFLTKYSASIYLFILIYGIGFLTLWSDSQRVNWIHIRNDILWVSLSVFMYFYFIKVRDYAGIAMVSIIATVFIITFSITSIIGLTLYPGASRQLAMVDPNMTTIDLKKMGVGDFGFFSSIIFIFPPMLYYFKNNAAKLSYKILLLILVGILLYSVILSNFTTTILLSVLVIVLALLSSKNTLSSLIFVFLLSFLLFLIFQEYIASFFYFVSGLFPDTILEKRFADVGDSLMLSGSSMFKGQTYATDVRLKLSLKSLYSFLINPIYGAGDSGGHAYWLDRLGLFGMLGFLPWIILFRNQVLTNLRLMGKNVRTYYLVSFSAFILFGLAKSGMGNPQVMLSMFFISPGLFYMDHLKRNYNKLRIKR